MTEPSGEKPKYEGAAGGGAEADHAFSWTLAKQTFPPLRTENPGQQISSVNLNPILRKESPGQKAVGFAFYHENCSKNVGKSDFMLWTV